MPGFISPFTRVTLPNLITHQSPDLCFGMERRLVLVKKVIWNTSRTYCWVDWLPLHWNNTSWKLQETIIVALHMMFPPPWFPLRSEQNGFSIQSSPLIKRLFPPHWWLFM
jgi:hypothetical protein